MQQELEITQEYTEGSLYEDDLVILYNITWSGVSSMYYTISTEYQNQAATKVQFQEDDANFPLQVGIIPHFFPSSNPHEVRLPVSSSR